MSAENYANSFTQLNYQRILTPVAREVALAERFADSTVVKAWLKRPNDSSLEKIWLEEAQGYLDAFQNNAMFIVNDATRQYYFADQNNPLTVIPKYTLNDENSADRWYFSMRQTPEPFNINVNYDEVLKVMKAWVNVQVRDQGEFIGLAGTGFSLDRFIDQFLENQVQGVTPFIINADGKIEIHRDETLITQHAQSNRLVESSIYALLGDEVSKKSVKTALANARQNEANVVTDRVKQEGHRPWRVFV